jgi:5,10-methylenetetrahydromethanopterin reductase
MLPELDERIMTIALRVDELGYDNLWVGDHCQYDIYSILTMLAEKTQNVRLGTSVTNVYTRHPATIAAAIATVNKISGGRAILGLGAAVRVLKNQFFPVERPLTHLKEAIQVIKPLLAGEKVQYQGKTVRLDNYRLHIDAEPVPVFLAARGPKMLQLAGETADGVFINGLGAWPPALEAFLDTVNQGASNAGRDLDDIEIVCWTRIAIAEDPSSLKEMIRPVIALRLSLVPNDILTSEYGVDPELAAELKNHFASKKKEYHPLRTWAELGGALRDLVPDSIVERYCLCGTPEQVVNRIRKLVDAGANQISFLNWPQYDRPEDMSEVRMNTLQIFSEHVIPAFR